MNAQFTLFLAIALSSGGCAATPPVKAPVSATRSAAPAVVLGLLAAGGVGTGIAFMIQASAKDADALAIGDDLTAHYGTCVVRWASYDTKRCSALHEKLEAVDRLHDDAISAFIGGGAAAAGTALFLLWRSPGEKRPKQAAGRNLRLEPMLSPTGGEFLISGSFW